MFIPRDAPKLHLVCILVLARLFIIRSHLFASPWQVGVNIFLMQDAPFLTALATVVRLENNLVEVSLAQTLHLWPPHLLESLDL